MSEYDLALIGRYDQLDPASGRYVEALGCRYMHLLTCIRAYYGTDDVPRIPFSSQVLDRRSVGNRLHMLNSEYGDHVQLPYYRGEWLSKKADAKVKATIAVMTALVKANLMGTDGRRPNPDIIASGFPLPATVSVLLNPAVSRLSKEPN